MIPHKMLALILVLVKACQVNLQGQPAQNQQFQQQGSPQQFQSQQGQINQPPPQQQFNQPPQQQGVPLQQQQQQFQGQPPPPQQQFQVQPPQQQQQFQGQPPPQFQQAQPQQQFQQVQPGVGQPVMQPAPPPGQGQRFAPGVAPPQQQQRMAPGVPPPQQQQQRMAPGVPPPQQQAQRFAPGVPPPQPGQQQVRMQQAQPGAVPPGMTQQQFLAQQEAERQRLAGGGQGQPIQLPPGVSPQQFAAMQQQQQAQARANPPQQFPPGHAANIAPPTPPPPPAGGETGNWLDDAPGIAMEYKVHVDAGKEDCYWQYVHPGATLYISYQVLKGGDGAIGVAVRNPAMQVVHPYKWEASSEYEESDIEKGGYYSVCLDNQFSRFSAKLVNLYITTFRYDEWEKFSEELKDMDVTVENFTSTLKTVDQRIQIMRQFQTMSRGVEARDFNLIQDNSSYVQKWSLAQIAVVIICTIVQVNFVKSFFKDPKDMSGGGMKMRT